MFLDKFDLQVTAVDGKPCDLKDTYGFTFWSSGKVDRLKNGVSEEVTKDEVLRAVADLGVFYGITKEEFAAAVEKERPDREACRKRLAQ